MIIARQSTARTVIVGPVLDADGVAVTDGVVADFKIAKNGGAPAALNGSATLTHRHTGFYSLALTASDLDTVGQAEITIDDTTNSCGLKEITVVEEAVYDVLYVSGAAPGAAGQLFIAGTNAPVTITGSGTALTVSSTGSNGYGVLIAGNGSGAGVLSIGGATGAGVQVNGGGTSGDAVALNATDGDGLDIRGGGTSNHGMRLARGGSSGDDLAFANSDCTVPVVTTLTGHTAQTGDSYAIVNSGTHGLPAILTQFRLRVPRKTWFVSPATGNDSNAGTYESPLLTPAAAIALTRPLDTIVLMDSYTGTINLASNPWVTLEGITQSVTVTATVTSYSGVITGGDGTIVRRLTVTTATDNGTAITYLNKSYGLIEDCILSGVWDCVLCGEASGTFPRGFRMYRNYCYSKGDVLNVTGAKDIHLEGNTFYSDGTGLSVLAGTEPNNCILASNGTTGLLVNNTLKLRRSTAYNGVGSGYLSTGLLAGATSGGDPGKLVVRGGSIDVATLGATDGGTIRGIASHYSSPQAMHVVLEGVGITTALAGTGTAYDIDASTSGSKVSYVNSRIDQDKLSGASNIESGITLATDNGSDTVGEQLQNAGAATSSGGPIEQRPVAPARVMAVRDRGDGTFGVVGNGIQLMPGERQMWALEFKGTLLAPGSTLFGMSEPDEDGDEAANLTVNDYGVDRTQAKAEMTLSGSATTTDDIEVDFTVQISATETVVVTVPVTVGS